MSTLRYIAYLAEDPAKLVEFYHRFLGTEELGRWQPFATSPRGRYHDHRRISTI
jgi:hypothetical protein